MYIHNGTPLSRPPNGQYSVGRVSGAGVVATHLHFYRFHILSRSLHFYNSFLASKLFSFVLRAAIAYRYFTIKSHNGKVNVGSTNSRRVYSRDSQSGQNRPLGGDFEGQRGEKNEGGNRGQNNKGGKMLNHYTTNQALGYLQLTIIELTSAVALMLSMQRNRLLVHKRRDLRLTP